MLDVLSVCIDVICAYESYISAEHACYDTKNVLLDSLCGFN